MSVQWGFMKFKADAQKCFDWDDSSAAEKWRIQQARFVCNSFTVVVETTKGEEKAYRLVQHDHDEKVYRPVTFTVRNEDQYESLLRKAKAELAAFKNRYQSIVELENVIEEIDRVLNQ